MYIISQNQNLILNDVYVTDFYIDSQTTVDETPVYQIRASYNVATRSHECGCRLAQYSNKEACQFDFNMLQKAILRGDKVFDFSKV